MAKKYSRKDFIKISSTTAAALLLVACGGNDTPKRSDVVPLPPDSLSASENQEELKSTVELIRKNDPRYEELRKGFNKRIEHFPLVIALCRSTEDVVEAIRYARDNNLGVTVKSGGHSMEGFSGNNGGLVVNLSKMNNVEFLDDHHIKVGPGCTLSRLYDHILPEERLIPAGSCGTVALGGLTTGGGYGLFARKYGLTCDNLLEATFVDGNGEVHSTKDDPELLWALRGGGSGNFGVVTELIYRSYAAPATMQTHHLKARNLDAGRARLILERWFAFSSTLPESCFSAYVLNGSTLNILVTNFEEHTKQLQEQLEELAMNTDEFRSGKQVPLQKRLKGFYGSLAPVYFKNSSAGLYKDFSDISAFISEILEHTITNRGMIYQVNTLGGKISDSSFEQVSSYPHRAYSYISELQAYWEDPSREEKLTRVSHECLEVFSKNGVNAQYINYCSLEFKDWKTAYYGENYPRLQAVKKKYDPDNILRHPQSISA